MSVDPAFLAEISLFAPLDDDERALLAQAMVDRQVKPGEVLFRAGEPGDSMFIVVVGGIELSVKDKAGQKIVLHTPTAGEFFGELSLLDGGSRTATATAAEASSLYVLDREDLLQLFKKRPEAGLDMLGAMGPDDAQGERVAPGAGIAQRQRGGGEQAVAARPDLRRDRGVLGEHGVPHPQRRVVRGVDRDERRADAVVQAVRSVSVRPADDDRVARGDLLVVLRADQPGPPVHERPRAVRDRIRGQHQGRARGRAPPREDRPHPRGDARPVHADRESTRRRAGPQARHRRRNREGRVERTDDAALRRLTTYSRRVLSVAEAARAVLAKLPRLHVERVASEGS